MYLSALAIDQFRSYRHLVLDLSPGVHAFIGRNGQGKTNLLEAIYYLATLSSHRVGSDRSLIRFQPNPTAAVLRAKSCHPTSKASDVSPATSPESSPPSSQNSTNPPESSPQPGAQPTGESPETSPETTTSAGPSPFVSERLVELEIVAGRANRARLNRNPVRPRALLGQVSAVLFAPEDLGLIRDEPATRRKFLDDLGVQLRPALAGILADYEQVARQRAAYLRQVQKAGAHSLDRSYLRIWDEQLAPLAAQITLARAGLIRDLSPLVAAAYQRIAADKQAPAALTYNPSLLRYLTQNNPARAAEIRAHLQTSPSSQVAAGAATPPPSADLVGGQPWENLLAGADPAWLEGVYLQALAERAGEEARRGQNLIGPHRDELDLTLGPFPVKGFASHGETWSFALALRLGAFHHLRAQLGATPLLLLDDVFAELDEGRRRMLLAEIEAAEQVFITCALGQELPPELLQRPDTQQYQVTLQPINLPPVPSATAAGPSGPAGGGQGPQASGENPDASVENGGVPASGTAAQASAENPSATGVGGGAAVAGAPGATEWETVVEKV